MVELPDRARCQRGVSLEVACIGERQCHASRLGARIVGVVEDFRLERHRSNRATQFLATVVRGDEIVDVCRVQRWERRRHGR